VSEVLSPYEVDLIAKLRAQWRLPRSFARAVHHTKLAGPLTDAAKEAVAELAMNMDVSIRFMEEMGTHFIVAKTGLWKDDAP